MYDYNVLMSFSMSPLLQYYRFFGEFDLLVYFMCVIALLCIQLVIWNPWLLVIFDSYLDLSIFIKSSECIIMFVIQHSYICNPTLNNKTFMLYVW